MFNGAECLQIPAYDLIAVQKGIPAGYEHIGYFRVGDDVGSHLVHISGCFAAGDSHQPLAEAMPAIHGAPVGGQDERRLPVLVLQAGQHCVIRLPAGIKVPRQVGFTNGGYRHPEHRILFRIVPVNKRQIVSCDCHGKLFQDSGHVFFLLAGKPHIRFQFVGAGYIVSQCFIPIHPIIPFIHYFFHYTISNNRF